MSTSNSLKRIPLLGVILIAVGLILLMDQMGMIRLTFWSFVMGFMVLFGATLVIRSMDGGHRGKVFWGTVLFLFGIYLLLDSMGMITTHYPVFVPAVFLMLGFSFLMMYIYDVTDWHLLIPTLFFTGIGALIIVDELSLIHAYRFEYYFVNFWPVVLILFGVGLIAKARRRKRRAVPEPAVENAVDSKQ